MTNNYKKVILFQLLKKAEKMNVGKIILAQVGLNNLLCFAAKDFTYGKTDRKTHYGYLEFTASGNPNFVEEVRVRIELSPNDTYAVKVFDFKDRKSVV